MTMPNQQQIESAIRWLLTTGGPLAGYLMSQGATPSQINNILTVALVVVPPAISFVWGLARKTDKAIVASASTIQGVSVAVDKTAPAGAQAAAQDAKLTNVNPV